MSGVDFKIQKNNKFFPELLNKIPNPPKVLYSKGNLTLNTFTNCLSVVGSRKMSSYGEKVVSKIVLEIAAANISIVSGFMYGVDAAAHKAALLAGGTTIAVLPCGINNIIPAYQKDLYNEIINNKGLIISEFEESLVPKPWMFVKRNRIIAGISPALLVIEAAEDSGSLITAKYALKYKRKVFVVIGSIFSSNSYGIVSLLKMGATPILDSKDILDFYKISGIQITQKPTISCKDNAVSDLILKTLVLGPMTIDDICQITKQDISSINTQLTKMQLQGVINFGTDKKVYVC